MIGARNARLEASELLPAGFEARVLEPSPPAVLDSEWWADDPTDPGAARVVTPIPGEGTTWAELAIIDEKVAAFAREHWLDGARRLAPLPRGYDQGRRALHQLGYFALAPARFAANGKLALRATHHGFGTPFYVGPSGRDQQVRLEGDRLVLQRDDAVQSEPITTIGAACRFVGVDYREKWFDFGDLLPAIGAEEQLRFDAAVTESVAAWFGFITHVLERTRRTPGAVEVSRVQLWPEHFDPAIEMGSESAGQRASYGGSPGDSEHPEPYLYVSAWGSIDRADPYWNDTAFNGASLDYQALLAADDPYATALEFFDQGHRRLPNR